MRAAIVRAAERMLVWKEGQVSKRHFSCGTTRTMSGFGC